MELLKEIVADLPADTSALLFGGNRGKLFTTAITEIINRTAAGEKIVPEPRQILAAFRACPVPKVVLLGQDPYQKPGVANGLSFGCSKGKSIQPSLRNIYKCLVKQELLRSMPTSGDLTPLAAQSVLLMNCALTTTENVSGAHQMIWRAYSDELIRELSTKYDCAFILLGAHAAAKATLIGADSSFVWGHPSPMNSVNLRDCPENFINCTAFGAANKFLSESGRDPVDYNVLLDNTEVVPDANDADEAIDQSMLYIFTDGAASKNGKADAKATWGFYAVKGTDFEHSSNGLVDEIHIPGKVYKSSNQRGELTAILRALEFVDADETKAPVCIVSDSEYGIKSVGIWVNKWLADRKLMEGKMNLDLIVPAAKLLKNLRKRRVIEFRHVRSHKIEPPRGTYDWFMWYGNDCADQLCAEV